MFSIYLTNLKFFSFHGLYQEEKILGGEFVVDAIISFTANEAVTTIEQTIDYTKIYELIKQRMAQSTALLETVAQDLAHKIQLADTRITAVDISIKKINPPIAQFSGSIAVRFKKEF